MRAVATSAILLASLLVQGCTGRDKQYGALRPFRASDGGQSNFCSSIGKSDTIAEDRFKRAACDSLGKPSDPVLAKDMLSASFALTDVRCNDLFAKKMDRQVTVSTLKSAVAPILTTLTGVLALWKFDSNEARARWQQAFTLASTATLAGISIYDEQFLYSSENINDVRELANRAMGEYKKTVLSLDGHTFDSSVTHSLEYHMICSSGKIKSLVKAAIKEKKITIAEKTSSNETKNVNEPLSVNSSITPQ